MDTPTDLLPPPDPAAAARLGQIGAGLAGLAAVAGLALDQLADGGPGLASTARLWLCGLGCLTAGVAVSRRPDRWATWAFLAAACWLAGFAGVPAHWDSIGLLGRMAGGVATCFAAAMASPVGYRPLGATAAILFHFAGILGATTWPAPTPWVTQQMMVRAFNPYLRAVYLVNAYHFYSPEPGPASLLCSLIQYEIDDPAGSKPTTASEWKVLPNRGEHMKDPLGLSYYRRLSLTEAASQTLAEAATADTFNRSDATQARGQVAISGYTRPGPDGKPETVVIPLPPPEFEPMGNQYRVPDPLVTRNLLPSYARHQAHELTAPGRRVTNVKMYRLEHRVVPPAAFLGVGGQPPLHPYHPTTYRAYFLGDYTPDGALVNPRDPLLYWLIPVLPKPGGPAPGDKTGKDWDDYLSLHAGFGYDWPRP